MKSSPKEVLSSMRCLVFVLLAVVGLAGCLPTPGAPPPTAPPTTVPVKAETPAEAAGGPGGTNESGKDGTNAEAMELLEGMTKQYFSSKSYRDKGSSITKFLGGHPFETKVEFHTAFRRPYEFRFEYSSAMSGMPLIAPKDRMIVHGDCSGARTWWSLQGKTEKCDSLGMAIAGAGGVSGGTAFNVSNMLLPFDVFGHQFMDDRDWLVLRDAEDSGRPCRRVTRRAGDGDTTTLWIGRENGLLLRVDECRTVNGQNDSFKTESTTLYKPEMDVDITDKELAFNAPSGKSGTGSFLPKLW